MNQCCPPLAWRTLCIPPSSSPGSGSASHHSRSIVDAALGRSRAASVVALTRVDGHAHAPVSAVAVVTGARVLVGTRVDAGGVDVAHTPETRVDGWWMRHRTQRFLPRPDGTFAGPSSPQTHPGTAGQTSGNHGDTGTAAGPWPRPPGSESSEDSRAPHTREALAHKSTQVNTGDLR